MTARHKTGLSRRTLLAAGAAGGAALIANGALPPALGANGQSLGALAAEKGLLFGASFAVHELDSPHGEDYARIYTSDARILTSELEFKLSDLRPTEDRLDFSGADRLVAFARANAMEVRAHTLIWNDDVPAWIAALPAADAAALMDMHIETVMQRFDGQVRYWDVVNEPVGPWDKLPGNLRKGPFYAALGEGYIAAALRKARAVAPSAVLVLNEAQCETDDETGETFRIALRDIVRKLKAEGVPLDAVGFQSHLKTAANYDLAKFADYLEEIAALGVAIHITELDVNDTGLSGSLAERDRAVAALYRRYLDAVLRVKAVKAVQTWQLSDKTSWMQDASIAARMKLRSNPRPLLYDEAFRRKPAWEAVAAAIAAAPQR